MSDSENHSFGSIVRSLRIDRHLSQQQLADAAGVSLKSIESIESGRRTDPHLSTMAAIARGLSVRTSRLIPVSLGGLPQNSHVSPLRRYFPDQPDGIRLRGLAARVPKLTRTQIAAELGITVPTLAVVMRRQGLIPQWKRHREDRIEKIRKLSSDGQTAKQIAKSIRCSLPLVYYYLRKINTTQA